MGQEGINILNNLMFMAFACKEDAINEIVRQGNLDTDSWRAVLHKYGWDLNDLSEYEINEIIRRIESE